MGQRTATSAQPGRASALHAASVAAISRLPALDEQRVRWARRSASQLIASGSTGLTLVELLVTIVILGILGGVVSFAVGTAHTKARSSACATERSTLQSALESYRAMTGAYGSETQLVTTGLLRDESTTYDVALSDDSYELTPVGACTDAADALSSAAATTVPAAVPSSTVPTTPATTTVSPATTTVPPSTTVVVTTTTTTPLHALTLLSVCTPRSLWHDERAWQIGNTNSTAVSFSLEADNASPSRANPMSGASPPGASTWYLPVAGHGSNVATLDAAGHRTSATSTNRKC